jgi:hypothetical protein
VDKSRPNPICAVCEKSILSGLPRYRRGLSSVHVECATEKEKRRNGPNLTRASTAVRLRLVEPPVLLAVLWHLDLEPLERESLERAGESGATATRNSPVR